MIQATLETWIQDPHRPREASGSSDRSSDGNVGRAMNEELRARGHPLETRTAGNVMLVQPKRSATKRQRVAFEATEQEPSTREPTHVVGAEHDARQIPDCIGHTRFEREDLSLGGPAGMLPPE